MPAVRETVDQVSAIDVDKYKYGFETDIETDKAPKGLNEDTVRFISAKKNEPEWMLEWRLEAYRRWLTMTEPTWARVQLSQDRLPGPVLLRGPKSAPGPKSLDEVDPELLRDVREARHPAEGAGAARRRRGRARRRRRGVRFRFGRDHLQGGTGQARDHLLLDLRGDARTTPNWCSSISARSCR